MNPKTRCAWEIALEPRDGDKADDQPYRHESFDTLIDFWAAGVAIQDRRAPTHGCTLGQGLRNHIQNHGELRRMPGTNPASRCPRFSLRSLNERKGTVSCSRLCHNCPERSHVAASCPSQCTCCICGKLHHTLPPTALTSAAALCYTTEFPLRSSGTLLSPRWKPMQRPSPTPVLSGFSRPLSSISVTAMTNGETFGSW